MKNTPVASVDDYLGAYQKPTQALLTRVRITIRKALPDATEMISYRIPTYKLYGRPVLYFAAWKQHYSIYPSTARLVAALKKDLSRYEVEKGTIRFPLSEPVPVKLIARIAKFRAKEVAEDEKARATARKNR